MSSLWDSRFRTDEGTKVTIPSADLESNGSLKVGSILAAAGRHLPEIQPHQLAFYSHLGAGSCFKVNCEVYTRHQSVLNPQFVAVKHMQIPRGTRHQISIFYDGVMRELRVLTHPLLKDHACLIPALAFGWSNDLESGLHPYLVVDYSNHGTLNEYLKRLDRTLDGRRELALDVAAGLQALHPCVEGSKVTGTCRSSCVSTWVDPKQNICPRAKRNHSTFTRAECSDLHRGTIGSGSYCGSG